MMHSAPKSAFQPAGRPNEDVWTLSFHLTEYTPAEIERMTGVPTASQRDWRRHGYLPKHEAHARFTVFSAAEIYVMKMFADQGKGPSVSSPYASRIALSMVKTGLIWRNDVWATDPVALFDRVPELGRSRTRSEHVLFECGEANGPEDSFDQKREWIVDQLLGAMGALEHIPHSRQAIWWPNGEIEIAFYNDEHFHVPDKGPLDRIDPKFDGPASVLHLEACAANLARRSRLPFLSAKLDINEHGVINRPELRQNHGKVKITSGKQKGA